MKSRFVFYFACAFLPLLLAVVAASGCGGGAQVETAPPDGWQADGARWWAQGADTAKAFRDLSSVEAMGVAQGTPVYSASTAALTDQQVTRAAKQGLEKLYRKAPENVDSLFAEYVAPKVSEVPRSGDMKKRMEAFSKKQHETLTDDYFRPPAKQLQLGEDIPVGYPDSLFQQGVGGNVQIARAGDTGDAFEAVEIDPHAARDKHLTVHNDLWPDRQPEAYALEGKLAAAETTI